MRLTLLATCLAVATLTGCAGVSINESAGIERVLANPARSAADRERDARDKPAEVLALARFKRGDTVADLLAGGGYYSEILSGIVGPGGKVLLVNNTGYEASLERNKLYVVLSDKDAETDGDLRVVDESGEDYLFSAARFVANDVPAAVKASLLKAS